MEIAVTLLLALAMIANGLMAGLLFAERRERRETLKRIAAREKDLTEQLQAVGTEHNKLVSQVAEWGDKISFIHSNVASGRSTGPTQTWPRKPQS